MNVNDNPDSTAPLPSPPSGDFETYVRDAFFALNTRLDRIERYEINLQMNVDQLSRDVSQLNRDQHDRYIDLRMRLSTLDEKIDAHLREVIILKRDLRGLQEKVDPTYSA